MKGNLMSRKVKKITENEADAYRYIGPPLEPKVGIYCRQKWQAQVVANYLNKKTNYRNHVSFESPLYNLYFTGTTYCIEENSIRVYPKSRLSSYNSKKSTTHPYKIFAFENVFSTKPQSLLSLNYHSMKGI